MRRVVPAAVLAVWLGACGPSTDRHAESSGSSADRQGDPAGASDASDQPTGLTGFVAELIVQQTDDGAPPVALERFASLPDPDGDANNLDAYASLFRAPSAAAGSRADSMIHSPDE